MKRPLFDGLALFICFRLYRDRKSLAFFCLQNSKRERRRKCVRGWGVQLKSTGMINSVCVGVCVCGCVY